MEKERKAIVKSTNTPVVVYRLNNGKWCDSHNCTTQYSESELIFT